ncbi:MAG: Bifunctional deaminase-reductase domain protein [Candidatus Amesbacteria bacterium GW2011_GWB1_47_19]|nr:MAG: Bifunctional deaminase-reductase domain protein [Candidatus Amesbacteria bacterium GW2011_GWA1_44_24]KKU32080.1 MAG: Bifunctional deaminase-reductase domain protein [Candidatus Amesbacteria bacterium GW2011_GWC1_46_24]KKU67764.1 MAG: Bifunctional deaminase-reductase domain protein [Candidatus Amesbacteria bacterium GW2011_GWB1_47_19]OGD06050.1 MAG: hypothetical protein A2379_03080 [Candidatus Amesbacteria bacterium RIFOXYB1_FULL_47_13]HBC72360.1 hypothetical protein [Candidatus Amesbact
MKTYFYIASSINGCIADKDGNTPWSDEDNASFMAFCGKIGAVVMGRKTYEEYLTLPSSDWPNPEHTTVILTSRPSLPPNGFKIILTPDGPQGAVSVMSKLGKKEIVVAGGNQTWTSFMKEGLVDEIFLDIEPLALGNGKALFQGADFNIQLEFLSSKPLSPQTLQLHYLVKK